MESAKEIGRVQGGQDKTIEDGKLIQVSNVCNRDLNPRLPEPSFEDIQQYVDAGHMIIPLQRHSKCPLNKGWTQGDALNSAVILEKAKREGLNIGVRLKVTDLIIDVDPRNGGDTSLTELMKIVGLDLNGYPHVITGGGGHHYYLRKPADVPTVGKLPKYPGIDFKSIGGQVVAAGSVHPNTGALYRSEFFLVTLHETPEAPDALLDLLKVRPQTMPQDTDDSSRWGELTPALLARTLDKIPAEDFGEGFHDEWFKLMCACHHATAGEGRQEFIDWSTQASGYSDHCESIGYRWDSLSGAGKHKRKLTTILHLCKVLNERGLELARVDAEDDFDLVEIEKESAPSAPLGAISEQWVWVADASMFIRRHDLKRYTADQWRSMYAHTVEDSLLNKVWKSANFVRKFESLTYLPKATEMPDGKHGRYNIWRPSGVTPCSGNVDWFLNHMAYLVPDEHERGLVFDYLAHLIQRPQEKIHFALVMRGTQGTGKSAIGELMMRIIGKSNVTKPSNDELLQSWNRWQEGAQLAIIEELMTMGRLEVTNRLKPLITEPTLRIQEKYQTTYTIDNCLNLLCFTNHRDALKIEEGDRRWFIIFSPATPLDHGYYCTLFEHINGEGPSHVAHWLMTRDLSGFDAKGHAPATAAKDQMRGLSMNEAEAFLMELYQNEDMPFDCDLVTMAELEYVLPLRMVNKVKNLRATLTKFLNDGIGAVKQKRNTNVGASGGEISNLTLWSIRNHGEWGEAGPTARSKAHFEHRNQGDAMFLYGLYKRHKP